MIELKNLNKAFGEKQVLKNLNWTIPEGSTSVIMGPSGGGKTTLLRILLGLEHADSGTVLGLEGKRLSAVFQEDRLCENVSAVSNLRLVNPALSRKSAENMLEKLGLSDALRQPVRELSGGMKRRVAIARALCTEYDVLLADEPFKGLDEETKRRTMEFFSESVQGKTVIIVTHDPSEAEILEGRILLMETV